MRLKDFSVAEIKKLIALYDAGDILESEIEFSMVRRALEEVLVDVNQHGKYETKMMGCVAGYGVTTCAELHLETGPLHTKIMGQVWHEHRS